MSASEATLYSPQSSAAGRRPPRRLLLGMMVAVFFSGGIIGSGSTLMLINRRIEANEKHHDVVSIGKHIVSDLRGKLSLSDEQTAQVDQIMKEHLASLDRLRREDFSPKLRVAFKQMEDQVAAVLDDEQRSQWHAWLEERRKRVCPPGDHRRPGHPHHRGGPPNRADQRGKPSGDGTAHDPSPPHGSSSGRAEEKATSDSASRGQE
jgi:BMFP domain-containing protein YqiC